ncbi:MAG: hypothetical protein BMS9Abin37_3122 [Acidobacteriota bacterium]|nr:MAG: hypothetical protein BMS9Abin37_3122 [Acidobacteriota bacterium]
MIRYAALASLVFLAGGAYPRERPVVAQEASEEKPWGYVYVFGSPHAYPLTGEEIHLGRLSGNEIMLTSPRVSRRHATIRRTDEGIEVLDVGSSNGSRVNGTELRAGIPVSLSPEDRIQLADELLLFHTSLDGLWNTELRLRLLSSMVNLNVQLPQDFTKKSFGREEVVTVEAEARLNFEAGTVELTPSVQLDPDSGFLADTAAFVGNVLLDDGVLELSLWSIEDAGSMTSRRASISRLKHTTLKISVDDDGNANPNTLRPWFPQRYLHNLFEIAPESLDTRLRFATSLARQKRPVALRDASATLALRHALSEKPEWKLLALSAEAGGAWVEGEAVRRRMSLTQIERNTLREALETSRSRLERARALGAKGQPVDDAASAIERAQSRLAALDTR